MMISQSLNSSRQKLGPATGVSKLDNFSMRNCVTVAQKGCISHVVYTYFSALRTWEVRSCGVSD
jgi:hypothetical protein